MLRKLFKLSGVGFAIGMLAGNLVTMLLCSISKGGFCIVTDELLSLVGNLPMAILLQTVLSGLYGSIALGSIIVYNIERWPLALSTAVHCLIIILCFVPAAFILGWESTVLDALIMAGIQLVVFFIIWLIMNAVYKAQVRELNKMQSQFQDKNKE